MVNVKVNYLRDSFSVLLRAQHYSMLAVQHRNHSLNRFYMVTFHVREISP